MHPKRYRDILLAGASRLLLTIEGEEEGEGAGGGAPEPEAGGEDSAAGAAGEEDVGGAEGGDADPDPAPKRVPWQNKRIAELTGKQKAAEEALVTERAERERLAAETASYKALYGELGTPRHEAEPAGDGGERRYTATEMQQEAARIASVNNLNQRCEDMYKAGAAQHAETWGARIGKVSEAFGAELIKRPDFFDALTTIPNGADVYHELGADLDHMAEVLAMTPVQLGMELARISAKTLAKPKGPKVSAAPAPIDPIGGGGANSDETDLAKMPMDQYAKTREAQREARAKERGW